MSLVFLWRWGRDARACYLTHRVRDTMPGSTKLSSNGRTFLGSPMLGEAQFCVPNNNPYQIMRSTFTIELKKEKNLELDNTRLSSGGPYHSGGGSSTVTRLPNGSLAASDAYWSLIAKGLGSSHSATARGLGCWPCQQHTSEQRPDKETKKERKGKQQGRTKGAYMKLPTRMTRSKIIWNPLKAKIPNKNPSLITNARVLFRRSLKG
jgi:hypothetical protein